MPYKLYHIPQKGESRITMEPTTGKAKYYTLMEVLKEQILSGTIKPGEKLPSENELTRQYDLSRHTVRKALSLLENEGYITAYHGKGTFCSERVIQRHNSKNIAVVTTYLSDYIFPRLIQGMDRVLSENGYSIILKNTCNSRSKEEKVLKELLDKPIDGLIIEPSKSQILCRHINLYEMLDKYQIPYVFIQGCYPQMAAVMISFSIISPQRGLFLDLLAALTVLDDHAGAGRTADHHGLSQNIAGRIVDVGTGRDDFLGDEGHLAGGVADIGDLAGSLDIIAGMNGSHELDFVISLEQALVAVVHDQQLGSHIAEQVNHVGAVHQVAAVVGVLRAHTQAKHRSDLFHRCFLLQNDSSYVG